MSYPRIFSMSTVGILKHYVHDYLFHQLRTDFIGPNGVGKSIIADLLQLMFIYDTDLIKFGTDGVKQDVRTIYKLPYETSIAYCFLNIEVKEGKFLIIGIAIQSQVSARIIPFLITKDVDTSKSVEELCLTKEEILLARDFLVAGNSIPDSKMLADNLFQNRKLYCTYYKTKEEVNKYYQFLYDKQVLSINLSVSGNLKAFAKVVQSFSKARTLDLKPASASKSLKQFLFEESDAEFLEDYSSQQHALEKLLRDYNNLDKYIKVLEHKQQGLTQLKKLNDEMTLKKRELYLSRLSNSYNSLRILEEKEYETETLLSAANTKLVDLEKKINKLPIIENLINQAIAKADQDYDLYTEYSDNKLQSEDFARDLIELKMLNSPKIPSVWKASIETIDMSIRSIATIKEAVQLTGSVLKNYKNLEELEEARRKQQRRIQEITIKLNSEQNSVKRLIRLLESSSVDSVVQWVIQRNKPLSKEQEAVVMRFAEVAVKKINTPAKGEQYVNPEKLITEAEGNHTSVRNGFWITLGPLNEFIEMSQDDAVFGNPESFDKSVAELVNKLKASDLEISAKLGEMEKVNNLKPYSKKIIGEEFDLELIEYSRIEKIKEALACILQLSDKIKELESRKNSVDNRVKELLDTMSVSPNVTDADVLKKELQTIRNRCQGRSRKFTKHETNLNNAIESVNESKSKLGKAIVDITSQIIEEKKKFDEQYQQFFTEFSENVSVDQLIIGEEPIVIIEKNYMYLVGQYRVKYNELVNRFDETSQNKSGPVNLEISNETYEFKVLEHTLLGNKIIYTDDIGAALTDANAGRLSMAEDMKNSMVKIFDKTLKRYKRYKELVHSINTFFKGRKISNRFYFNVDFAENKIIKIEFLEDIGARLRYAAKQGELAFDKPVSEFIEEFFKKSARLSEMVPIDKLLNPKTYFDLSVSLTDENRNEIPGSTGETYSAIALLGIARLSLVQVEKRKGIRFIILEEIGSLDNVNFSTFPAIATEYDYQIITMSPQPFRTTLADEWYAHHLIKGKVDENINYHPSASYFKTKDNNQDLKTYLKLRENELDRSESPA